MSKFSKMLRSPVTTVVAFALAAVLLLYAGIGTARAAFLARSEYYATQIQMYNIGVSLLENDKIVSYRDYDSSLADGTWDENVPGNLLSEMVAKDDNGNPTEEIVLKKQYEEKLKVRNTGRNAGNGNEGINEFVRVSIYKYWLDKDGKKMTELSPSLINLTLAGQDLYDETIDSYADGAWVKDKNSTTDERVVLYYTSLLYNKSEDGATETPLFADAISIDNMIAKSVTQTTTGNKIVTTYDYDGVQFCLEAHVDAVQEHNAQDAITSAWGRNVSISGTTLSLS